VEELTALCHACDLELALGDESIEQSPQRGGPQLVPKNPQVVLVSSLELRDADPPARPLHRERPLLRGEVGDPGVEHPSKLRPVVPRNVIEDGHEAMTVRARSDTNTVKKGRRATTWRPGVRLVQLAVLGGLFSESPGSGRCPARTGDLVLVRRE
jgi:hypothetical protein